MSRTERTMPPLPQDCLTIADAASTLNVSEASVRNWVKTGYLHQLRSGLIGKASFDTFVKTVVGHEKLTLRANKSRFDSHDHAGLAQDVRAQLADASACPHSIAAFYEGALSASHRNREGIFYTPMQICEELLSRIPSIRKDQTFCDPCCGSGNFLVAAYRAGVAPDRIYGFDVDPLAVAIAKRRFEAITGHPAHNIKCLDYLEDVEGQQRHPGGRFDMIFTNPPWGKKLTKIQKEHYRAVFNTGRSIDTSSIFLFAALSDLHANGYLGLLLPESFFVISQFQNARQAVLARRIETLQDFGKPFKGLLTRARAFVLKNEEADSGHEVTCLTGERSFQRLQGTFCTNPREIMNFSTTKEEAAVIRRLFETPHETLAGKARWGLGIVTGNNRKFCKNSAGPGLMPVYTGAEIFSDRLEGPANYIPQNTALYQQVAARDLYEAPAKIIYRFISSRLVFHFDTTQAYVLNSANLFVLDANFPVSPQKVADLFNLPIYTWLFQKIFDTHKILRSDIECLPIYTEFLGACGRVNENALLMYLGIEKEENGTYRIKR